MSKRVAVVGAGIGGLSAAIRLAAQGLSVIVLEQNDAPGGKMREVRADGFRWDTGPSVITMRPVFEELFTAAGEKLEDHLSLVPVEPLTRYFYSDGTVLDATNDRQRMAERIAAAAAIDRRDIRGYQAYLDHAAFLERVTGPMFIRGERPRLRDLAKVPVRDAVRLQPFSSMHRSIKGYVRSPHLQKLFGRFATYIGSSPYLAPATLGVISDVELNQGVWYPEGGVFSIARALYKLAGQLGVDVKLNCRVRNIVVEGSRATGVRLSDGDVIKADAVLANVDAAVVYNRLLPHGIAPAHRARDLSPKRLSCSGFILLLGVSGRNDALAHHNIFFPDDYRQEFDDIFERCIPPREPTVYVSITSKTTPEDAAPGCENWYVMVNAPAVGPEFDWNKRTDEYRLVVLDQLARFGFDPRGRILSERVITPNDIEARTASWRGALYGELFNSPWVAFRRPASRAGDISGLYLAGGTTHPGGGVPMVMLSGKLAAKAIMEDLQLAGKERS